MDNQANKSAEKLEVSSTIFFESLKVGYKLVANFVGRIDSVEAPLQSVSLISWNSSRWPRYSQKFNCSRFDQQFNGRIEDTVNSRVKPELPLNLS